MQRRAWLEKLSDEDRVDQLKYWLKMLWGNQDL